MSTRAVTVHSIQQDLDRIGAIIDELSSRERARSPRDQDLEALIHKRERVVTKLSALRLAGDGQRSRHQRELNDAWIELDQAWARIQLKRVFDAVS